MTSNSFAKYFLCMAVCLSLSACKKEFNPADGAPPAAQVVPSGDMSLVTVDKPDQFPLVAAERVEAASELNVTGSVYPDISREVPVISLASGRVVDIKARLDDYVKRGDLLLKVQSPDITNAYDVYLKAVSDEQMTNKAYVRAKDLYAHGAIAQEMLEQAEDAETDNKADLGAAEQQLTTLGIDKNDPHSIVPVYAPISGVIVAQNVTIAAAQGVTYAGNATAFTIADLSVVWIVCDVYENDMPKLQLGQSAKIKLAAYPDRPLTGRISDIGPVLDPAIRTAKVRIEMANPGILKLGMFVTATFSSNTKEAYPVVPESAILHLHDRDWVFVPAGGNQFRRVEVNAGEMLADNRQRILSGITPGQQVVSNVLQLEATLEAQQ
ncbi:MAG TPA: efflux RND transporter periplasmic adaptor subunit [Acidobacteriaceae bacterium]|jgi:cobalt-zinc-cadmium efflux system membrane fusion protein|nr:efflux RND transporter periplasmic adaptor subunit [Acidobacteriaceae bacterium]